ncbi:hypothetical protein PHISCL_02147 [Aspergillus sclerotialis]|uniref:DUF676 domain-containing protein n=1 Tax=Aspergillus sclerotialis TaxID=2070753 RepID=A0A3A3A6C0_9EURO|nr:hypothetical protein PHISCL_02147 [Aspergillus sclerotialis]
MAEPAAFLRTLIPGQEPNIDKKSHAERTWEFGGKLWLRDFLPKQLPRARILLFGYNSNVGIQSSSAGVREQAQNLVNKIWVERQECEYRPILFIAHSLGGIVVKEALVQAKLGEKYGFICTATFGIEFFSTPHRGSSWASIGDIFAKAARATLRNPGNTFLNALKKGDLYASELTANFQQLQERYKYLNFYETLPLKKIGLIVDKSSAILGLPDSRETAIPLTADHESICRFACEDDEGYKHVSALIVDLASSATQVGREHSPQETCSSTATALVESSLAPGTPEKGFFAIEFAYKIHAEKPQISVFWIHASTVDRFREGYYSIAKECDIPANSEKRDRMSLVKNWLEREHNEWLLIIDNADESSLFVSEGETTKGKSVPSSTTDSIVDYLPECPHGSILVTTRNRAAGVKFLRSQVSSLIEVKTMTEAESNLLIKSNLMGQVPADSEIHELAELLGHLPLALSQASAFMQENTLSARRDTKVPNAVATTLNVSIFQIKNRDPRAVEILSLVAFADRHDIPKSLIQHKINRMLDLTKALGILKAFSLVNTNEERSSFSLHRLVQLVMRKWLIIESKFDIKAIDALNILAELSPDATFENRNTCATYLPHAQSVLSLIPKVQGSHLRRKLCLQEGIAWYLWAQGCCNEAEKLDLQILEEKKQEFGTEHSETLESIANLASTYEDQGRWSEVEELDQFMLEKRTRLYGRTHALTLGSMENLAKTYRYQGRLQEAEGLMLEVLELRKSISNVNSEEVVTTMGNLGTLYLDQNRQEEAEELILQAWGSRKRAYGADHLLTLDSATTLGLIYSSQGRLDEAEKLTLHTLQVKEGVLGPTHPNTLYSKSNLASIYQKQQEWEKAEELMLQVIKEESERLDPTHYDVLVSKQKLSIIYFGKGHISRADELENEILRNSINSLGPGHRFTLECMHNTALTRKEQNRDNEAI